MYDYEDKINGSVFPGHQGGPHNHTITALAVALKQAQSPEFKKYQEDVVANMASFADNFNSKGYKLVSGGTDNHLALIDLRDRGVPGAQVERVLELGNIALNKNTVPGDTSALVPGGIRLGTPALTTRGFGAKDFDKVADFCHRGIEIARTLTKEAGSKKMVDFHKLLASRDFPEINELKEEVTEFSRGFPFIDCPEL